MPSRTRLAALLLGVLALTGCEEHQEAVPLSRSLTAALLQIGVVGLVVGGGWTLLHRASLRRDVTRDRPHVVRKVLALYPAAVVALSVATMLFGTLVVAFGYREDSYQVLSWTDTVWIVWILIAFAAPLVLLHLRMIVALWRGRRWADVVLGLQAAYVLVWGLVQVPA